jgi:hypothetical protein
MRAFFYQIYHNEQRMQQLAMRWLALKGEVSVELDRTVRYVFTDSPRPWQEAHWNKLWTESQLAESAFYMVPAQWIYTLKDPISFTTIPQYTIKRTFDKVVHLYAKPKTPKLEDGQAEKDAKAVTITAPIPIPESAKTTAFALLHSIEKMCVRCQYGDCTELVQKGIYDDHVLQHLKKDQIGQAPQWKDMMFLNAVIKPIRTS